MLWYTICVPDMCRRMLRRNFVLNRPPWGLVFPRRNKAAERQETTQDKVGIRLFQGGKYILAVFGPQSQRVKIVSTRHRPFHHLFDRWQSLFFYERVKLESSAHNLRRNDRMVELWAIDSPLKFTCICWPPSWGLRVRSKAAFRRSVIDTKGLDSIEDLMEKIAMKSQIDHSYSRIGKEVHY